MCLVTFLDPSGAVNLCPSSPGNIDTENEVNGSTVLLLEPSLQKQLIAKEVVDSFSSNRLVAVFHYNDVTCQEWKRLRNKLAKYEIKLKVFPAKLSSKVLLWSYMCMFIIK